MQEEIWKDIPGYEGIYQLSSEKRIKSLKRLDSRNRLIKEKILNPTDNHGYKYVWLTKDKKHQGVYIDKLYYEIFEREGEKN